MAIFIVFVRFINNFEISEYAHFADQIFPDEI